MLKYLKLINFRNHRDFSIDLENTNILIGPNGVGKTNVLEAVAVISCLRSFRDEDKKNLVSYNKDFLRINGYISKNNKSSNTAQDLLEVFIQKAPRLRVHAKERGISRKVEDFIGILPVVVFSPETMGIITGSPAQRRRFLNIVLCQTDREYLRALACYDKARRQRNSLLQRVRARESDEKELDFWDEELSKHAVVINQKRDQIISHLNNLLSEIYQNISGRKDDGLKIIFHQKSGSDLREKLAQNRVREIAYGATIYGPHRDDLEFILNSNNMSYYASRGELKSAILALKVAELKYIEKTRKEETESSDKITRPTLLLDDIFSEFDEERRGHLSDLILKYQTLITTTDKKDISDSLLKKAKLVEM